MHLVGAPAGCTTLDNSVLINLPDTLKDTMSPILQVISEWAPVAHIYSSLSGILYILIVVFITVHSTGYYSETSSFL